MTENLYKNGYCSVKINNEHTFNVYELSDDDKETFLAEYASYEEAKERADNRADAIEKGVKKRLTPVNVLFATGYQDEKFVSAKVTSKAESRYSSGNSFRVTHEGSNTTESAYRLYKDTPEVHALVEQLKANLEERRKIQEEMRKFQFTSEELVKLLGL